VVNKKFSSSQLTLPVTIGDKASFDNFWVGHNSELVTALQSCILKGEPRMLYFYGRGGAGKSHLLYAAMRFAKQEILASSYLSLKDTYASPAMLETLDVKNLVCIDDVQHWAANSEHERALFSLFEQVKQGGGQLIVSANQPPRESGFHLTDLVSRLASGLVYPLHALSDEQQFEAIRLRAQQRGLSISDDTVRYLLSRSSRNTTELFSILDEIDKASLIEKRKITIPFLQSLLLSR